MKLTRRDAVAALAAIGATSGIALGADQLRRRDDEAPADARATDEGQSDEELRSTMVAVANVVYPTDVVGVEEFVGGFLDGRLADPDHAAAVRETVGELEALAESWHDNSVTGLSAEERDQFLREVGVHTAEEDPDGTTPERVRYYVVNELLLALYASPTGGELVGIENPQGHPGGTESYTQGPR